MPAPNGEHEIGIAGLRGEELAGRIVRAAGKARLGRILQFDAHRKRGIFVNEYGRPNAILGNGEEIDEVGMLVALQVFYICIVIGLQFLFVFM